MNQIIGKKIEKIRGYKTRKDQKDINPIFILFDEGKLCGEGEKGDKKRDRKK